MKISNYLTLDEATKSQQAVRLGIDNTPNEEQLDRMKFVATEVFDKVREYVNGPLAATSFFRCLALNEAIGGSSPTSQHMTGEAVDLDCDVFNFGHNNDVLHWIARNLQYDQLIGEYPDKDGKFAWVHCSKKKIGVNRQQTLVKLKDKYVPFEQWKPGEV